MRSFWSFPAKVTDMVDLRFDSRSASADAAGVRRTQS